MAKSDLSGVYWVPAGNNHAVGFVTAGVRDQTSEAACLTVSRSRCLLERHIAAQPATRELATSLASLWQCAQHRAASGLSVSSSLEKISFNVQVLRPVQGYARMLGISRLPLIAPGDRMASVPLDAGR